MVISLKDLESALANQVTMTVPSACYRERYQTVPFTDSVAGGVERSLTETGRWLLKSLETMTHLTGWVLDTDYAMNRIRVSTAHGGGIAVLIGRQELDDCDPVALLDCFTCAACGCDTSRIEHGNRWKVVPGIGMRARSVCVSCGGRGDRAARATREIAERDQRLGIHQQAIVWGRGGHGVRLEKTMAEGNYTIKINSGGGEFFDPKAIARAMRGEFDRYADKQVASVLGRDDQLDAHRAAIQWADREINKAIGGQMVALQPDGTVKKAEPAKSAHEFRVGDRVRLSHPGWAKVIRGAVTTIAELSPRNWFKLKMTIDGRPLECGSGMFDPLFKVGSRVRYGTDVGTILEPSTEKEGQRWAVRIDGKPSNVLWHRSDSDLELLDSPPIAQPKPEQKAKPCDWCGDKVHQSEKGTDAHVRECVPLEKLYRERIAAGGADCPEARDEVRRFVMQRGTLRIVNEGVTNGDADRVMATRPRGEKMLSLDQRIAAARVEERPRHASDWSAWSTFTDES